MAPDINVVVAAWRGDQPHRAVARARWEEVLSPPTDRAVLQCRRAVGRDGAVDQARVTRWPVTTTTWVGWLLARAISPLRCW
jgi:hypothetical protein